MESTESLVFSGRVGRRRAVLRAEPPGLAVEVGEGPQRLVPWAELRALEVRHELRWVGVTPIDAQGPGPMVVLQNGEMPEVHALMRLARDGGTEIRYTATPAAYLRNEWAVARSEDFALRSLPASARALGPAERVGLLRITRQAARWTCALGIGLPLLGGVMAALAFAPRVGIGVALGVAVLSVVVLSVAGLQSAAWILPRVLR